MSLTDLALYGGSKSVPRPLKPYATIGEEEVLAGLRVLRSGQLSGFYGSWGPEFFGGPKVQEFERALAEFFGVRHAITVNSWTSGLIAAVGALDVEPGDEIIVSPWTMAASATAILHWNCIPVFADIEPNTFCIDPASVEANISSRTKAIMAVDIFGQSADMDALQKIANRHSLKIISDTAQSPGALYRGTYAGTLADIGGFSLNYHKHIHTGEGGVLVTNSSELAERMQLIRNHAEAVVDAKGVSRLNNMIGYNFRLGEIEAAIGIEQLKKLPERVASRQQVASKLTVALSGLPGIHTPVVRELSTHSYYVYPIVLDLGALSVNRGQVVEALVAEGLSGLMSGYTNLHLLPMYQRKIAYGQKGFPWNSDISRQDVSYARGICPVAERLHRESFLGFETCRFELSDSDISQVIAAFDKVFKSFAK